MKFDFDEIVTVSVRDKETKRLEYVRFIVHKDTECDLDAFYGVFDFIFPNGYYKHSFDRKVLDYELDNESFTILVTPKNIERYSSEYLYSKLPVTPH